LLVSAGLILRQRDLKRMLAYSSIEHMGILALAAAIGGPLALSAALLHVLGHGLAKSSTFLVAGRILITEGTTEIGRIRALLTRRPGLGVPLLVGMAALLGFPPFSLFFSEVAIVLAGFRAGMGKVMVVAVVLILFLFAGLARHTASLLFGSPTEGAADNDLAGQPDKSTYGTRAPLIIALGATGVIGFAAGPLASLMLQAAQLLGARP
jgi:hydrogenase-4 component F